MITLTDNLKKRVQRERAACNHAELSLRIGVDSGGCAGFRYSFSWARAAAPDDARIEGGYVIIDPVSLPFLQGTTIDFSQTLMGEDFVVSNPQAISGCGCGQSFMV